jgi:hypothetical protein
MSWIVTVIFLLFCNRMNRIPHDKSMVAKKENQFASYYGTPRVDYCLHDSRPISLSVGGHRSRFHLKTGTESSPRNVVFLNKRQDDG